MDHLVIYVQIPSVIITFNLSCTKNQDLRERKWKEREEAMEIRAMLTLLFLSFCFFSTNLVPSALAIWLTLPATGTKCVSEEIQSNVVVLADYVLVSDDHSHNPTIGVKVPPFPFFRTPFWDFFRGSFFNLQSLSVFFFS